MVNTGESSKIKEHIGHIIPCKVYSHHKTLALMRKHTKKRDTIRPGVTRFALAFLTLQSLIEKKRELRAMALSVEWDCGNNAPALKKAKGKIATSTLMSRTFWNDVSQCLKVFEPLVKVLHMVNSDEAKKEIMVAAKNLENTYNPIFEHIAKKMEDAFHVQGWITDGGDEEDIDPISGLPFSLIYEASGATKAMQPRRSARVRELHEDDFNSGEEDEANEEGIDFESDKDEIVPTKVYDQEDED
uniref:Uncharacterized protein n=1 Tax=Oryza meridionalis TaxID=40149 RepID=A0A0E0CBX8_9ORYZ